MMTRNSKTEPLKRVALFATVAALAVTVSQTSIAAPATTKAPVGMTATAGVSGVTDFSSQRRRYARRGGGNGGAAAAAAIAGIVGTAIIASQANRGYRDGYEYGGGPYESYAYGPGYGGGGPSYYGGGGYYGGRSTGYFNGNGGVPLFKGRPLASW